MASSRWTRLTGVGRRLAQSAGGRKIKAPIIVAAQEDGKGIGRIRLRSIPNLTKATLHGFIAQAITPGSTVRTDGLPAYMGLDRYAHDRQIQRRQGEAEHVLPRVHRVISLLKRWLLGTHQGAIGQDHLNDYLDEFTFRFRPPHFYLSGQAVLSGPTGRAGWAGPLRDLVKPQPVALGGVK
jgi:transposase-like protein